MSVSTISLERVAVACLLACALAACSDDASDGGDAAVVDGAPPQEAAADQASDGPPAELATDLDEADGAVDLTADLAADLPPDSEPWGCPTFAAGASAGTVDEPFIDETSGITASRRNSGVLWIHNDSGDSARFFALDTLGELLVTYQLTGATATDWEDIAAGPGPQPGEHYLFIGDIGDNLGLRSKVRVYRVVEPSFDPGYPPSSPVALASYDTFELTYPEGPQNAETLLVDGAGALYIVTKAGNGHSRVYRTVLPTQPPAQAQAMELVATLHFGSGDLAGGGKEAVGGDVSPTGSEVVIKTYGRAFLWYWPGGATLAQALAGTPCPVALPSEPQGEAITFAADGQGLYTLSEDVGQPLYFYQRQ